MQGIRIPLRFCNFVDWLDLKSALMEKWRPFLAPEFLTLSPFLFENVEDLFFYCGIALCELDDMKLPVYKIDLNSSALLLSCLS